MNKYEFFETLRIYGNLNDNKTTISLTKLSDNIKKSEPHTDSKKLKRKLKDAANSCFVYNTSECEICAGYYIYRTNNGREYGIKNVLTRNENTKYCENMNDDSKNIRAAFDRFQRSIGQKSRKSLNEKLAVILSCMQHCSKAGVVEFVYKFAYTNSCRPVLAAHFYLIPIRLIWDNGFFVEGLVFRKDHFMKLKKKQEFSLDDINKYTIRLCLDKIRIIDRVYADSNRNLCVKPPSRKTGAELYTVELETEEERKKKTESKNEIEIIRLILNSKYINEFACAFANSKVSYTEMAKDDNSRQTLIEAVITNCCPSAVRRWVYSNPYKAEIISPRCLAEQSRSDIYYIQKKLRKMS